MDNPAAWHPDPLGRHEYRWWDGSQWTEHVADGGVAAIDPLQSAAPARTDVASPHEAEPTTATNATTSDAGGAAAGDATAGDSTAAAGAGDATAGSPSWSQPGGTEPMPAVDPQPDQPYQQPAQPYQQPAQPYQQPAQPYQQQPVDQSGAWPAAGSQQAPGAQPSNGMAVAALIIGIVSLLIAWVPFVGLLGGLGGALAVIFGFIGLSNVKKQGAPSKGAATAGIVLGLIAVLLSILASVAVFVFGQQMFGETFGSYIECVEETGDEEFCERQLERDLFGRFGVNN